MPSFGLDVNTVGREVDPVVFNSGRANYLEHGSNVLQI
jgi:hypothetical protein